MTEAGWTRNTPTKEGWYWWQRTENDNPVVVWVNAFHPDKQLRAEMISGRRELLTHFTGLFKGPITPDSYQQGRVSGMVECTTLVTEFVEAWLLAGMVAKLLTPAVHEAVAGLSRDLTRELQKLAQQAQDEKEVGDG